MSQLNTLTSTEPNIDSLEPRTILLMDEDYIAKALEFISAAKTRIWICAYTWRWYENHPEKLIQQFNYQIARKSISGVQVRAIVDSPIQALSLRAYGIATKTLPTKKVLHTKAILIDDKTLIIGSHNLTEKGTSENFEASIAIQEPELCLDFADYYERLWENWAVYPTEGGY